MDRVGMNDPVVIAGIGEVGGVFARAFLYAGFPVYPILRDTDQGRVENMLPSPLMVLICVGEKDLHDVLNKLPTGWRNRVGLVQNELLPKDWQVHQVLNPTVMSVWFEKKKGRDVNVVIPSPVYGPNADLLQRVLDTLEIPSLTVETEEQMLFELVRKNLYILVTNVCGLKTGGTVGELWSNHELFARQVANDVLDIQEKLVQQDLDRERLITAMLVAFNGDPGHGCLGRTASQRLQRAVDYGDRHQLDIPTLRQVLNSNE